MMATIKTEIQRVPGFIVGVMAIMTFLVLFVAWMSWMDSKSPFLRSEVYPTEVCIYERYEWAGPIQVQCITYRSGKADKYDLRDFPRNPEQITPNPVKGKLELEPWPAPTEALWLN